LFDDPLGAAVVSGGGLKKILKMGKSYESNSYEDGELSLVYLTVNLAVGQALGVTAGNTGSLKGGGGVTKLFGCLAA